MTPHEQALAIREAIVSTEIAFYDNAPELLARFKATGREIAFSEDGKPLTTYDSRVMPLADALTAWAIDDRTVADGRTLPKTDQGKGRPGTLAKSSFATTREKADWIAEHGVEAFERLPLKPPVTTEVKFREDFFSLPRAEKVKRLAADPGIIEKLPNRPRDKFAEVRERIDRSKSKFRLESERQQQEQVQAARA